MDRWQAVRLGAVVACSALKRTYRRQLMDGRPDTRLVYLKGTAAVILPRLEARRGHFMPPSLLPSQFATLEEPGPDEAPIVADVGNDPEAIVDTIETALFAGGGRFGNPPPDPLRPVAASPRRRPGPT
jgi:gluconokinase